MIFFFLTIFWQFFDFDFRNVESTDCAPNNGYYFLPLSPDDRGAFVLKGKNLVKIQEEGEGGQKNVQGEGEVGLLNV